MLNQTVLVGRITMDPQIEKLEEGKNVCNLVIAIPRAYKNDNGEYETDFIPVILWNAIADTTIEYCHKGDIVGIKGRLESVNDRIQIIAEKVTFLSSKNPDEE